MRKIEVLFTKSKLTLPIGSWLIRLWTLKPYSHCAVKLPTKEALGANAHFQSSDGMVNCMADDAFNAKHEIVVRYEVEVTKQQYKDIRNKLFEDMGKPYGMWQNVGIVLTDILRLVGINTILGIKYEQVAGFWNELQYPDQPISPKNLVRPIHIQNLLQEHVIWHSKLPQKEYMSVLDKFKECWHLDPLEEQMHSHYHHVKLER